MSVRHAFRVLSLSTVLFFGCLVGAPMHPQQIEELLSNMRQPKVAHTLAVEDDDSDDADTSVRTLRR